jgi:hypothetical protein
MEAPDRILAHDCSSAVDADGGLGDPNRHFAGDKLQLRRGRTVKCRLTGPAHLADDPVADLEAGVTVALGIAHAEIALFAEQLAWKYFAFLRFGDERRDIVSHETGDRLPHLLLLG